ncbi:MAG: glycosyltransferase family 39 protein [bacterium]|nr:glycosyltransferase family 39 protein [bacterium]
MDKKRILILILIVSAVLRLYGLSRGDTVNDEVFMSFRGIGMIDFDEAEFQTTPWEWTDPSIPWWANISFHDHPLLVPAAENLSMKIFGENNFGFRLPSAILGTASVYLIYLIGTILYTETAGLISAAFLGITLNSVYISRTGMQEPYVIFFLLLASYLFIKSLQKDKYLLWTGAAVGFGTLAKYNSLILVPIFITYLLLFKRKYFLNKKFWLGVILALLISSPIIIYNYELYRNFGHLDFQFSYIFGEHPDVWKVAPGKEIGTLAERLGNFIPRLIASNSWLFLSLTALSLITLFLSIIKNLKENSKKHGFLIVCFLFLILLILKIGPSYRFLTMLTPFFALSMAIFIENIYSNILQNVRIIKIAYSAFALFISFEIFYSINNQIIYYPIGPTPWLSSKVRFENYNWGYNQLGDWLNQELNEKMPAITFDLKYKFLEKLRDQALANGLQEDLETYPAIFIYDGNFDKAAKLWTLDRLHIYHGWPIISLKTYYDNLQKEGFDFYDRSGFKIRYFILQNNIVPSPASKALMRGNPISIYNPRGDEAFKIYKF